MTAEAQIRQTYERELRTPQIDKKGNKRKIPRSVRALIRGLHRWPAGHLDAEASPWVWSDQHLGHANIIKYCNRPFADVAEMDAAFFANWKAAIGADDTVLFVGDLAMGRGLSDGAFARVAALPGHKTLVVGNHDVASPKGELLVTGFDEVNALLFVDGDPPLVVTHLPLRDVPGGWVNVHGHTHNNDPAGATRHINVCVEQLEYRPVKLYRLRRLAGELAAGRNPPGSTTIERLRTVEATPC